MSKQDAGHKFVIPWDEQQGPPSAEELRTLRCAKCKRLKSEHPAADTRERLLYDVLEFVQFIRDRHGLVAAEDFLKRAEALGVLAEERP